MVGGKADDIIFTSGGTEVKLHSRHVGTNGSVGGLKCWSLVPGQ